MRLVSKHLEWTLTVIIDARGASITYGDLGGVCVSVREVLFCLVWAGVVVGGCESRVGVCL